MLKAYIYAARARDIAPHKKRKFHIKQCVITAIPNIYEPIIYLTYPHAMVLFSPRWEAGTAAISGKDRTTFSAGTSAKLSVTLRFVTGDDWKPIAHRIQESSTVPLEIR